MDNDPDRYDTVAAKDAREYARLRQRIEHARAELSQVQHDLADARSELGNIRAAQLLEANEALVVSAMRAQADAETATEAFREMSRTAELDTLTELPNRALLLDRFTQASASARRHGTRMALLFLDLDGFKQINDTLGHAVGDQVLRLVAARLASSVRQADTVSRYGGDEFVILLSEVSQSSDALLIAHKVLAALDAPNCAGSPTLSLTASIGISIYPDDGEDAAALIERADAAMYRAKNQGRGRVAFHGTEPGVEPSPGQLELGRRRPVESQGQREPNAGDCSQALLREASEANTQLLLAALSAQEMQSAAEQAQQRLTHLVAVVAHELRNPMAPIRTAAALLGRVRSEELPRLQAIIERQVVRVLNLIGDLLDVSRVSTGKLRLECHVIDMIGVIAEAVEARRPAMDMRLQHLRVDLPSGTLEVNGDAMRLVQIVSNLLDNASKYTPNGGEICLSVVNRYAPASNSMARDAISSRSAPLGAATVMHCAKAPPGSVCSGRDRISNA